MSYMIAYCPRCGHILNDSAVKDIRDYRTDCCRFCGFDGGLVSLPEQYTFKMFLDESHAYIGELIETQSPVLEKPLEVQQHLMESIMLDIDKNPLYNEDVAIKTAYMEIDEGKEMQKNPEVQEIKRRVIEKFRNESGPHCPTCGSTNIKKLDVVDRAVSVGMFGLASNKINKSFKCKNCGHTW